MALTKCKECGKEISKKAKICPHCGAPVKKKTGCLTIVVGVVLAGLILYAIVANLSKTTTKTTKTPTKKEVSSPVTAVSFKQVGYFKSQSRFRVFTFYVKINSPIQKGNIPDEILTAIKQHGRRQMHTSGCITASFYYFNKSKTPDVTMETSYANAVNTAQSFKPAVFVLINPADEVTFGQN